MVRVGIEEAIDTSLLKNFTKEVQIVRIPSEPTSDIEIDFWVPSLSGAISKKQWPHLKGVKVVQSLMAGVDVLKTYLPESVTLCDARGIHDIPTAEWATAAVLMMQKYFYFYYELQQKHDWDSREQAEKIHLMSDGAKPDVNAPVLLDEVEDKTILIVGYGSIGSKIEKQLSGFSPKFLRVARSPREGVEPVSKLDDLLPQADIVILITPLTSETRHLMNAARIAKMKPGALLVNAGRGPVVDTGALLDALNRRHIRAALDVTDPEPLPKDHPLWSAPNLFITPHVASDSSKFLQRAYGFASKQAERYARGEQLENIVVGEY